MVLHRARHTYLGLNARISHAWLATPLLILVVFIVKLVFLRKSIFVILDLAQTQTAKECQVMKDFAAMAAQTPEECMGLANKLLDSTLNSGMESIMHMLSLSVTAIENLVLFALEMTVGTYACLSVSAINGVANEALNATEAVISEANKTTAEIGKEINAGLSKLTSFMNGAIGLIDSVADFVTGGDDDIHKINLTVSKLDHLNISSSILTQIESLRSDIPTYNKTKIAVESAIKTPFEQIRSAIRAQNVSMSFNFTSGSTLSQFRTGTSVSGVCNTGKINSVYDGLHSDTGKLTNAFCGLCAAAIVLGMVYNIYKTWTEWRRLLQAAGSSSVSIASTTSSTSQYAPSHHEKDMPMTNTAKDEKIERVVTNMEMGWFERCLLPVVPSQYGWAFRYAMSAPLITYLCIGLAGIIVSIMELLVVRALANGTHALTTIERAKMADLRNATIQDLNAWQNATNMEIASVETKINTQILGWIHNSTGGLNNSVGVFISNINEDVNSAFGNTGLLKPMQAASNCLFENKLREIQKGLSWITKNSQVSLPKIDNRFMSSIGQPFSQNTISKAKAEASQVIDEAVKAFKNEINVQLYVSAAFILLWLLFTLGAILSVAWPFVQTKAIRWWGSFNGCSSSALERMPPIGVESGGLRRDKRPTSLHSLKVSSPVHAKSSTERLTGRLTRFFSGPAQQVMMESVLTPRRASIQKPDTPKTPLRAMILRS